MTSKNNPVNTTSAHLHYQTPSREQSISTANGERRAKPLSTKSKCAIVALAIGGIAGIVIIGLGVTHMFGPVGSTGYIGSLAGGAGFIVISGGSIFWIVIANCRRQEVQNSQNHNRIDVIEDNQESANDVPSSSQSHHQIKHNRTGTTAHRASISWPSEESLPAVNTQINLSSGITLEVHTESILVRGEPASMQFGIITNSQKETRLMASLLQKHQNLIGPLFTDKDSQGALTLLGIEIQKELPMDAIASWCFINGEEKVYYTQIFGNAKLRVNLLPNFGVDGICEHDKTKTLCSHNKPSFKLQLIQLTVYPTQDYEERKSFLKEGKFVEGAYHDSLPDHHWINLKTLWGDHSLQYPHPDHLNKNSSEI